jgi:hypothetical protein
MLPQVFCKYLERPRNRARRVFDTRSDSSGLAATVMCGCSGCRNVAHK